MAAGWRSGAVGAVRALAVVPALLLPWGACSGREAQAAGGAGEHASGPGVVAPSAGGASQAAAFLERLRPIVEARPFDWTIEHFVVARLEGREVALLIASTELERHVALFDAAWHERARPEWIASCDRGGRQGMVPDEPRFGDLDGDGEDEALLCLRSHLADRSVVTAFALCGGGDGWRAVPHPPLHEQLNSDRAAGQSVHPFGEAPFARLEVRAGDAAVEHVPLRGLSRGGGWRVTAAGPEPGARLVGVGVIPDSGSYTGPHLVALAVYRLGAGGFVPDANWNGGRAKVTSQPVRIAGFDVERAVAEGW